jgi:hypothetical protein
MILWRASPFTPLNRGAANPQKPRGALSGSVGDIVFMAIFYEFHVKKIFI